MNDESIDYQPNQTNAASEIFQRVAKADKAAIEECVNEYGNLIWALAKIFTNSNEEAEEAVLQIFNEIWKCARLYDSARCTEKEYVLRTAYRHLFKRSGRNIH